MRAARMRAATLSKSRMAARRGKVAPPISLGGRACLAGRVGSGLEIHIADERRWVAEREDLRRPIAAESVLSIDPVERVGQARPADRTGRPAGRRILVVDHEGVGPGFL